MESSSMIYLYTISKMKTSHILCYVNIVNIIIEIGTHHTPLEPSLT